MDNAKSLFQLGSLVEFAGRNAAAEGLYEEGITSALKQAELESLAQGTQTAMRQNPVKVATGNTSMPQQAYSHRFPEGDRQAAVGYQRASHRAYEAAYLPERGGGE